MVYSMLINTHTNKLEIKYKQQLTINEIKTGKGYIYKEITIPTELIRYYSSIINEDVTDFYYVVCNHNGNTKTFITPVTVAEDTDVSLLYPAEEGVKVKPDTVLKIPVRVHGNKIKNPRYIFRLDERFTISEDYVVFTVNPYLQDPVSMVYGLCTVEGLVLL